MLASYVENGKHVSQGDVLVELDPGQEAAEVAEYATSLASYRAEALRRRIAIETARAKKIATAPQIAWVLRFQLQFVCARNACSRAILASSMRRSRA